MAWTRAEGVAAATAEDDALRSAFRRLAAGDGAALEVVWSETARELHAVALWRTGSAEDAEDVVQETFVCLVRQRDRLGVARRQLVEDPLLGTLGS